MNKNTEKWTIQDLTQTFQTGAKFAFSHGHAVFTHEKQITYMCLESFYHYEVDTECLLSQLSSLSGIPIHWIFEQEIEAVYKSKY